LPALIVASVFSSKQIRHCGDELLTLDVQVTC
jgi:hypothetical protein